MDRMIDAGARPEALARLTRLPTTISPQAQQHLATMAAMPTRERPAVDDAAGWRAAAQASEAMFAPMVEGILARTASRIETRQIAGVTVHVATPAEIAPERQGRVYVYMHGGAFVFGAGAYAKASAAAQADVLGAVVYSVDYRTPPDHPFPAPLEDCLAVYGEVIRSHAPADVAVGGSSAGGNLAAATLLAARDRHLPLPSSAVLMTPETDLTEAGDSFQTHEHVDVMLKGSLEACNLVYAGGADLTDPYLSPQFADFTKGFPPTFIQSGTRDLFLSNCVRLHRKLLSSGVEAELHVWEAMPHGGFGGASPEDAEVDAAVRAFVHRHWDRA